MSLLVGLSGLPRSCARGVIFLGFRVGALEHQRVGPSFMESPKIHGLLDVRIERGARQPNEDQHHAEVHDVAAVAARVAHG